MAKKKKASKVRKSGNMKSKGKAKAKAKVAEHVAKKPIKASNKPRTKSEILSVLSDATGITKKEVNAVYSALSELIGKDIGKAGPGLITLPGLMKVHVVHKPATKARKGTNPFTGEEMMFKAKPARNVVKIRALKALKDQA